MRTSNVALLLSGEWEFCYGEPEKLVRPFDLENVQWLAATVPGTAHTDLMAHSRLKDPFFGKQEAEAAWVEDTVFWYRKTFTWKPKGEFGRVELCFDGLDTVTNIYLNGKEIASTANMFIQHVVDVTHLLQEQNELLVKFTPVNYALKDKPADRYWGFLADTKRQFLRKAQYSFGWDWGPRLATCGLWKNVYLQAFDQAKCTDLCVRTRLLDDGAAEVILLCELENVTDQAVPVEVTFYIDGPDGACVWSEKVSLALEDTARLVHTCRLDSPELWWCAGQGDQPLYTARVEVNAAGRLQDFRAERFGVREIKLLEIPDPDEQGASFIFELNGRPIFCKGANWIPADSFLPRVDREQYELLLRKAVEANMNMLRVWGGGIYEQEPFYELCDELGLMVWQDFMFACGDYPGDDPNFVLEVETEVRSAIRRLRNHPSIVLWCGNNENDWGFYQQWCGNPELRHYAHTLYHRLIPTLLQVLDPTRPYRPSSPWGGTLDPNDQCCGHRHAYGPWGGVPDIKPGVPVDWTPTFEKVDIRNYRYENGRFYAEYGIQSPPVMETIEAWSHPEDLDKDSEVFNWHNKHSAGTERMDLLISHYFNPPQDFASFVKQVQVMHAEGLKCAIEHFRSLKFHCSGSLFWQFEDCWPVSSWAILDYFRRPKPAYYAAKRAYAPLLLTFQDVPELSLHLVNDLPETVEGTLKVLALTYDGEVLAESETNLAVPANGRVVPDLDLLFDKLTAPTEQFLLAVFESDAGRSATAHYYPCEFKEMQLRTPTLQVSYTALGAGEGQIELSTDTLAPVVAIKVPDGVVLEDNYFALYPGRPRTLSVREAPETLADELEVAPYVAF